MERLQRGLMFWVLLIVAVALPASGQTTKKKELYATNMLTQAEAGVGSSTISWQNFGNTQPHYMVKSTTLGNPRITRVSLTRDDGSWGAGEVVLCDGSVATPCVYDSAGDLDIEGSIVGQMLPPGVTPAMFTDTLRTDHLSINLATSSNTNYASGVYVRVFP